MEREREGWEREREALRESWERERAGWERERAGWERERASWAKHRHDLIFLTGRERQIKEGGEQAAEERGGASLARYGLFLPVVKQSSRQSEPQARKVSL